MMFYILEGQNIDPAEVPRTRRDIGGRGGYPGDEGMCFQ